MDARITPFSEHLFLITLPPPIPGFSDFISVWLYKGRTTFIVDTGPSATAPDLIKTLEDLGVSRQRLDYILLTHIHLDHAGGAGDVAAHFAETPVVCHAAAIPHLVDPSRLTAGTIATLGDTGKAYGPVKPIPENRLVAFDSAALPGVVIIPTPGHSAHHTSFLVGDHLVAGEAGGVHIRLSSGETYMRPATPPRFFPDITVDSIDRLVAAAPEYICYGHYGRSGSAASMLKTHKHQILLWQDMVQDELDRGGRVDIEERILSRLFTDDPLLFAFSQMDGDTQKRERFFLTNSIRGFVQALEKSKD